MTVTQDEIDTITGRSPHGERGLKYALCEAAALFYGSLPARGAWIEIRNWLGRRLDL